MAKLAEIVNEPIAKDSNSVLYFLQRMVKQGGLDAFSPGICQKPIPVKDLQESRNYILRDKESGANYVLSTKSYGGAFSEEGDQTLYYSLNLKRINSLVRIGNLCDWMTDYQTNLPEQMVSRELNIHNNTDYTAGVDIDYVSGESKQLAICGTESENEDELFKKVRYFAKR
jgi:hypothetical protein